MACNASHEPVGIFVLEGAAEIALRDGLVEQLGTYQFALITPGQSYRVNIANAPCTIGRVAYQSNLERARLLFKLLPSVLFIRSEEHTSELQSLMRISYAVYCLKKKKK